MFQEWRECIPTFDHLPRHGSKMLLPVAKEVIKFNTVGTDRQPWAFLNHVEMPVHQGFEVLV